MCAVFPQRKIVILILLISTPAIVHFNYVYKYLLEILIERRNYTSYKTHIQKVHHWISLDTIYSGSTLGLVRPFNLSKPPRNLESKTEHA